MPDHLDALIEPIQENDGYRKMHAEGVHGTARAQPEPRPRMQAATAQETYRSLSPCEGTHKA